MSDAPEQDPNRGTGTMFRTMLVFMIVFAVTAALALYGLTR